MKDVGDLIDNTEAQSGPDRRESEVTNISLGQVWRMLHRLGSGSGSVRTPRRHRRSGGLGTRLSNSSSLRSHISESTTKSGSHQNQVPEMETHPANETSSSKMDDKDIFSSKL